MMHGMWAPGCWLHACLGAVYCWLGLQTGSWASGYFAQLPGFYRGTASLSVGFGRSCGSDGWTLVEVFGDGDAGWLVTDTGNGKLGLVCMGSERWDASELCGDAALLREVWTCFVWGWNRGQMSFNSELCPVVSIWPSAT